MAFSPFTLPGEASMIADPSMPSYLITFCSTARPLNRMSCHVPVPAFCDPGACSSSCDIWRPLTGSAATSRSLTFAPMRAELMSMAVACASTVTVSDTPAGCSSRSRLNSWPAASVMSVYSSGWKFPNITLIV